MTNKELQEKIVRLEAELAELKKKEKTLPNVIEPENGQIYWYISDDGDVIKDCWEGHFFDDGRYEIGNYFHNRQEAEDTTRVLELIKRARESQSGFVPNWEYMLQDKYSVRFFVGDIEISTCQLHNEASMLGYWEHKWVCEQFIQENREELLWFFTQYQNKGTSEDL